MRLKRCEKGHYYDKDKFTECPHCNGVNVAPAETVPLVPPKDIGETQALPLKEKETENNPVESQESQESNLDTPKNVSKETVPDTKNETPQEAPKDETDDIENDVPFKTILLKDQFEELNKNEEVEKQETQITEESKPIESDIASEQPKPEEKLVSVTQDIESTKDTAVEKSMTETVYVNTQPNSEVVDENYKNKNKVIGYLLCIENKDEGNGYFVRIGRNIIGKDKTNDIILDFDDSMPNSHYAIITYDNRSQKCFIQAEKTRDVIYVNNMPVLAPTEIKNDHVIDMAGCKYLFIKLSQKKAKWLQKK